LNYFRRTKAHKIERMKDRKFSQTTQASDTLSVRQFVGIFSVRPKFLSIFCKGRQCGEGRTSKIEGLSFHAEEKVKLNRNQKRTKHYKLVPSHLGLRLGLSRGLSLSLVRFLILLIFFAYLRLSLCLRSICRFSHMPRIFFPPQQ